MRWWALFLFLASLVLTYPVVLVMIIVMGQQIPRTLVLFIGGSCPYGQMREL